MPAPPAASAVSWPGAPPGAALGAGPARVLALLAESDAPLDAAQVAAALGGHPNTARAHLEVLTGRRFVTRTSRVTGRRGRPRVAYEVTAQGHWALAPAGLEQLVEAFAEHLETTEEPGARAVAVGRSWGSLLARANGGKDAAPSEQVLALLAHAGFSPRRDPDPTGLRVALRSCPLLDAARAHPQVVCEVHRGMVAGALTAYGQASARVDLEPFAEAGACRLQVTFSAPGSAAR